MKKLLIMLSLFISSNASAEQIGNHSNVHQETTVFSFDNLNTLHQFYSCRIKSLGKQDSETWFMNCLVSVKGKIYYLDGKTKVVILESFNEKVENVSIPLNKIKVKEGKNKNKELYIHAEYIE